MRARIVEIMESYPVALKLELQDGSLRSFDTNESCRVYRHGRQIPMNELGHCSVDIVLSNRNDITEISVLE